MLDKRKKIVNEKNIGKKKKEKIKFDCLHELNWGNALVNSIRKEPFTGPNKALVNIIIFSIHIKQLL